MLLELQVLQTLVAVVVVVNGRAETEEQVALVSLSFVTIYLHYKE
jgi:hypothetical protein